MKKRVGVVIDPLETLKPKKDTGVFLMEEALNRGFDVFVMTPTELMMRGDEPRALVKKITAIDVEVASWCSVESPEEMALSELDFLLMRKDPPFDMAYILATYVLEAAKKGVCVINKPQSLRDCNEKFFITEFPQCIPKTVITADKSVLMDFLAKEKDIVVKPLTGMGGQSVERIALNNGAEALIERMLEAEHYLMAQPFLPEVFDGDKRIFLINGEPLSHAVLRLPRENEFRANLAQGGSYRIVELSARDRYLCGEISASLRERGLYFVGLDVIGNFISEINVTSPTLMRELKAGSDLSPEKVFWDGVL